MSRPSPLSPDHHTPPPLGGPPLEPNRGRPPNTSSLPRRQPAAEEGLRFDGANGGTAALFLRARHPIAEWGRGEVVAVRPESVVVVVSEGAFAQGEIKEGDRLESVTLFTARGRAFEGAATIEAIFCHGEKRALRLRCDHCVNVALTHQALEESRLRRIFAEKALALGGGRLPTSVHAYVSSLAYDLKAWAARMDVEQQRATFEHDVQGALQRLLHVAAPPLSAHLRQAAEAGRTLLDRTTPKEAQRATAYIQSALAPWLGRSRFALDGAAPFFHSLDDNPSIAALPGGLDAFGAAIDRYFAEEPGVVARKHQAALLADRIEATARHQERVEILALDASVSESLALVLARAPHLGPKLTTTMVTPTPIASDALAREFSPLANRCEMKLMVEVWPALDVTNHRQSEHGYDLILAAAAFDRVSDRLATERLIALSHRLLGGGTLLAATTARTSPSRFALGVFANRRQRYRSADDWAHVGEAVRTAVPFEMAQAIEQEPLGIQLLLRLRRDRR